MLEIGGLLSSVQFTWDKVTCQDIQNSCQNWDNCSHLHEGHVCHTGQGTLPETEMQRGGRESYLEAVPCKRVLQGTTPLQRPACTLYNRISHNKIKRKGNSLTQ